MQEGRLNEDDFIEACRRGHTELVQRILDRDQIDPSAQEDMAFCWACREGHLEIVRALLRDTRVNPTAQSNAPLYWACRNGHTDVVRELLDPIPWYLGQALANPGTHRGDVLLHACSSGYTEIVRMLLRDPRVDLGRCELSPLDVAVKHGQTNVVRLILKEEPRIVPRVPQLLFACRKGYVDIFREIFCDKRLDLDKEDIERLVLRAFNCDQKEILRTLFHHPRFQHAWYASVTSPRAAEVGDWIEAHAAIFAIDNNYDEPLYRRCYPRTIRKYNARIARAYAAVWCIKQMGNGLEDMVAERILKAPLALRGRWTDYKNHPAVLYVIVVIVICVIGVLVVRIFEKVMV